MLSLMTPFGEADETVVNYDPNYQKNRVFVQNQTAMWAAKKAEITAMLEKLISRRFEDKCEAATPAAIPAATSAVTPAATP